MEMSRNVTLTCLFSTSPTLFLSEIDAIISQSEP